MTEPPRYPGYDVMAKRDTPSWDAITRKVVDRRLATPLQPRFLTASEFAAADALCRRIVPQPAERPQVPLAALLDAKLLADSGDGFRVGDMPYMREAWRRGLAALDVEARAWPAAQAFDRLEDELQDAVLRAIQTGQVRSDGWDAIDPAPFFAQRVLVDVPGLYYGHPIAWSEIGFGGPASPRGYVRLGGDRRDPWEAAEARPGEELRALKDNRHVARRSTDCVPPARPVWSARSTSCAPRLATRWGRSASRRSTASILPISFGSPRRTMSYG